MLEKEITRNTKMRVLEKAAGIFAEKGFADTSIREIAEKSEVSASVLYHYFRNKQDLYGRALDHKFQDFRAMMIRSGIKGSAEGDELSSFLTEQIKALHASPELVRMVAWEAVEDPERGGGVSLRYFDELFRLLLHMLKKAIGDHKRLDLEITALTAAAITGFFFFHSASVKHALGKDSYDDEFIQRLCRNTTELFNYGIRGKRD